MQELIEDLKQLSEDKFNDKIEFTDFIKKQEQLIEIGLQKEKITIANAYIKGKHDALDNIEKKGFEYFNETYN